MFIVLSGPTGSGKSTTALLLKKKIRRPALVELDSLRDFIVDVPLDRIIPLIIEMAILVTKRLLKEGYNVILVYPLYDHEFKKIQTGLRWLPTLSFVLAPQKKSIQRGRGKRKLIPWEQRRVAMQYRIGLHRPQFGIKIDNTTLRPAQVVKKIIQHLPARIIRRD